MLTVAAVAALVAPDVLSRQLALVGCTRIWLCTRRGIWCLVDADDYGWLSVNGWNVGGHSTWKSYAKRNVGPERSTVYLHREVLRRHDPRGEAFEATHMGHHRNGQSLDCRFANLAWEPGSVNSAIRNSRQACPSLEFIVAQLARKRVADEIPY